MVKRHGQFVLGVDACLAVEDALLVCGQHGQETVIVSASDLEVVLQAEIVAQAMVIVEVHFPRAAAGYRLGEAGIDVCRRVITEGLDVSIIRRAVFGVEADGELLAGYHCLITHLEFVGVDVLQEGIALGNEQRVAHVAVADGLEQFGTCGLVTVIQLNVHATVHFP